MTERPTMTVCPRSSFGRARSSARAALDDASGRLRLSGGVVIVLGRGEVPLPLVYVEDVVDALLKAAESEAFDGSVFHVVDTARLTQNDLVRLYFDKKGLRLRLMHVPNLLVHGGAAVLEPLFRLLRRSSPSPSIE